MMNREDTIFAPSTAIGGAIAVIRISGPDAFITESILDRSFHKDPGHMRFCHVLDHDEIVDDIMAVFFKAPLSYTGEDMVELNCHGGSQTVQRILALLSNLGFRTAEGGEFTRRAFMNGKMDLCQAESVMDIINATAEQSRKAAIDQLHGSVSRAVSEIENDLLDALSAIDAAIDYPDEAEEDCILELPVQLERSASRLAFLISDGRRGRVLRDGLRVLILGRPNVGKSSVMNALAGYDRAIVTDLAGTTRDVLDEPIVINGVPVRLIDTAGIHETSDPVEQIGVSRAWSETERADVVLLVLDGSESLSEEDRALLARTDNFINRLLVRNKSDLLQKMSTDEFPQAVSVSAKTGDGLDELKKKIIEIAAPQEGTQITVTNERHIASLEEALLNVNLAKGQKELDCVATDIRNALHSLGTITGTEADESVIDRIFSRFCVGK